MTLFQVLISISLSAEVFPIIPESDIKGYFDPNGDSDIFSCCSSKGDNYTYNTFSFQCEEIDPNTNFHTDSLYIFNQTDQTFNITDSKTCPDDFKRVLNTCIPNITLNKEYENLCTEFNEEFRDECTDLLSLLDITRNSQRLLEIAHPQAIQFLANLFALHDYQSLPNDVYSNFFTYNSQLNFKGYNYWPAFLPFIAYLNPQSSLNYILDESYITSRFRSSQVIQFYLARYKWNGHFLGFTPLTNQFNKCDLKNDYSQIWRKFGTSLNLECFFDLTRDVNDNTNEFYDLFIGDGRDEDGVIMRPIPVQLNGRIGRRFYTFNNLTTFGVKFVDHTEIIFDQVPRSNSPTRTPYFSFNTRTVDFNSLSQLSSEIRFKSDSNQHPKYTYEVKYRMNLSYLTNNCAIALIIFGILALLLLIWRTFKIAISDGKYGLDSYCILRFFYVLFETSAIYLFVCILAFSVIFLIFFKFQKAYFLTFPENNYKLFKISYGFMLAACITEAIAMLIRVFGIQLGNRFIIMDWETAVSETVPVSAWRRINLSNELNRIISVRSYSIPFTIITLVFILDGLKVENLAAPIPTSKLIDIGFTHWILRFGTSSFIWILLMGLQYLFYHYIYWKFYGNPYFNFLDLCSTSNLSLFITTSRTHGFYLHGKSVQTHADVDMKELSQALVNEEKGTVGLRGLIPKTPEQVFEVFISRDFSSHLDSTILDIESHTSYAKRKLTANEISDESLAQYNSFNSSLRLFIEGTSEDQYSVQPPERLQFLTGFPLQIMNDTILNKVKDIIYKRALLPGAEWVMMLSYLILFCTIDSQVSSPGIAGFIVYIFDFIIVIIYERIFRVKLSKSSLLDGRFLLT